MSAHDATFGSSGCGTDAAPYVLGALENDESEAFRLHMARCVVCRDEVTALQAVSEALPMAAPQVAAPRGLKRRVMNSVRAESEGSAAPARSRLGMFASLPALGRPALAAGALVAVMGVLAVFEVTSSGPGGARVVQASVYAGSGSAALRLDGGHAELSLAHMPAPPQGRIYEVWIRRNGHHSPSPTNALFSVNSSGTGTVAVPGSLQGVSEVVVTPEPLGGSLVPTRPPVVVAELPPE